MFDVFFILMWLHSILLYESSTKPLLELPLILSWCLASISWELQGHNKMYHLKISIPNYKQVSASSPGKQEVVTNGSAKTHFVYQIEVGFLGEFGRSLDQYDERLSRGAKFYRIEKRYSSFLALHNEVRKIVHNIYYYICFRLPYKWLLLANFKKQMPKVN